MAVSKVATPTEPVTAKTEKTYQGLTKKQMVVAGGIRSRAEVEQLDAIGVDAVVGMAL